MVGGGQANARPMWFMSWYDVRSVVRPVVRGEVEWEKFECLAVIWSLSSAAVVRPSMPGEFRKRPSCSDIRRVARWVTEVAPTPYIEVGRNRAVCGNRVGRPRTVRITPASRVSKVRSCVIV